MNNMQKKTNNLLVEFDNICRENKIEYWLDPVLAGRALVYNGFVTDSINVKVVMNLKDCLRFKEIVEKSPMEDRAIEYMGNNKRYPSFDFSYVDETTTYILTKRGTDFQNHGVKIVILPLRKSVENSWATFLEDGWEKNGYRKTRKLNRKSIISLIVVRIMMIIGRKNLAKIIFGKLCSTYGDTENSKVSLRQFKTKKIQFTQDFFKKKKMVEFENKEYPIPEDDETYLINSLGTGWKNAILKTSFDEKDAIRIPNVPYRKYLLSMEKAGRPMDRLFKRQRDNLFFKALAMGNFKAQDKAWALANRSGDRLRFYEEFTRKQKLIESLYANEDFYQLDNIFAEHEETTKKYLKMGLGLCVSKEILDLQCELLLRRGEVKTVERLKALVPIEHMSHIKTK
ncbi:MAG: hypothetical protein RSD88_07745 [Anaerovoracaceae bacterium]